MSDLQARIEALQWALDDYNASDTDTKKNLEDYIAELKERQNESTSQNS